ncbi:MAG: hypothetical protein V4685_00845 [Bacteroidota bacterium]
MRKAITITALLLSSVVFQFCGSSKKTTAAATTSFSRDVMPILQASCTPCHFPPDGHKEPLNSLETVKTHIDPVIERVKLPKEDRRFMPMMSKKPPLTPEQIALLEKWKEEGMPD